MPAVCPHPLRPRRPDGQQFPPARRSCRAYRQRGVCSCSTLVQHAVAVVVLVASTTSAQPFPTLLLDTVPMVGPDARGS